MQIWLFAGHFSTFIQVQMKGIDVFFILFIISEQVNEQLYMQAEENVWEKYI